LGRAEEPHALTVRRTPRTPCEQRAVRQLTAAAEIRLPAPRRETRRLSHAMPLRDCNVLIRTLARRGSFSRVMAVYYDLRARGLAADSYTYPFVLMAISTMKLSVEGRKVHAAAVKTGFRWDAYTTCSLMEMYTMLGRRVFDKMPQRFLVLWNMMMRCYIRCGRFIAAVALAV
jgi:pentatricopeptide repeat protein